MTVEVKERTYTTIIPNEEWRNVWKCLVPGMYHRLGEWKCYHRKFGEIIITEMSFPSKQIAEQKAIEWLNIHPQNKINFKYIDSIKVS